MPEPDPQNQNRYDPNVPAVEQVMGILECLSEFQNRRKSLTEISRQVGIHKSRSYALLTTLLKHNVVARDPETKAYYLGPGLLPFTRAFLNDLDIRKIAQPVLDQLAIKADCTALLGQIENDSVFIVASSEGRHEFGLSIRTGHRFDLTIGAHGKAIVAFLPDEDRRQILDGDRLYFYGDAEHLDRPRLEAEFQRCRKVGYAVDYGELTPGITAISSPIWGAGTRIIGCIILVGIYSEGKVDPFGALVVEAAQKIMNASGGTAPQRVP